MRLSFRRTIVFCYLTICCLLSLLNYRFSTLYLGEQSNVTVILMDNNNNLHKPRRYAERTHSTSSLLSELWQLITHKEKQRQPTSTMISSSYSNTVTSSSPSQKSATYNIPSKLALWPEDSNKSDRILEQIKLANSLKLKPTKLIIYLPHGVSSWNVKSGDAEFEKCLANNCYITDTPNTVTYDAALHRNNIINTIARTSSDQIWIFYSLESPENTGSMLISRNLINWTATYRYDSDIVTPYEKFALYSTMERYGVKIKNRNNNEASVKNNYAKTKTKQVAWFVSNCFTNNDRIQYARNLANYIDVDLYGACGELKCSRLDPNCFHMLNKDYKFYLAFENSNCKDYITEKFFYNGLQ